MSKINNPPEKGQTALKEARFELGQSNKLKHYSVYDNVFRKKNHESESTSEDH